MIRAPETPSPKWGTPAHHPLQSYRRNPHGWRADCAEIATECDG